MAGTAVSLSPKQERFITEYVLCDNAAEAARRAGYSAGCAKVTACRMLTRANLKKALEAKRAEMAQKIELDQGAILSGIFLGISMARHKNDAGAVIRGWCQVGKILGLDTPVATRPGSSAEGDRLRQKFEEMSVEELLMIAAGKVGVPD